MSNQYFITKKTTATGKKFKAIDDQIDEVHESQKAISKEIGFERWRPGYWTVSGGFSALIFKSPPDTKTYKNVNGNEWMPRLNTKKGKDIQSKLDAGLKIGKEELNKCIGFNGHPFKTIGFARDSKTHYGFITSAEWKAKIPKDCKEVTLTEYNKLFK